jgi:hypothetical protein
LGGYAWQTGRYDIGKFAMDKIGARWDLEGFDAAGAIPARSMSGSYAFTGSSGKTLLQAESDVADGDVAAGIEKYRTAAAKVQSDSREALWINGRLAELTLQKEFDSGGWVNLMPSSELKGWYGLRGDFTSDGKTLTAQTQPGGAMLICGARFGTGWELRANVEILPAASGRPRPTANGGVVFGELDLSRYHGVFAYGVIPPLRFKNLHVRIDGTEGGDTRPTRDSIPQTSITVRCWDGEAEASADGTPIPLLGRVFSLSANPDARIGIGSSSREAGDKFKITELRIRKLTNPPNALQGL